MMTQPASATGVLPGVDVQLDELTTVGKLPTPLAGAPALPAHRAGADAAAGFAPARPPLSDENDKDEDEDEEEDDEDEEEEEDEVEEDEEEDEEEGE